MRSGLSAADRRRTNQPDQEHVMTEIADHNTHPAVRPAAKELELVACPECGHPAEVEWRDGLASTHGTIEHLKIRCVNRHWFLMPAEMLSR
jgi:hypothetical protein